MGRDDDGPMKNHCIYGVMPGSEAIKTMKRKWALSDQGKERVKDNG